MIKGQTKNIAFSPVANKEILEEENFIPFQIDSRNAVLTDVGSWKKRKGYADKWDTGDDYSIDALIPIDTGYAVNGNGQIYKLGDTITELTGRRLDLNARPTWAQHNDFLIICAGGRPVKVFDIGEPSEDSDVLGGNPPSAKFISRISDYTIMSGYDPTEFSWCDTGDPEDWAGGVSGFANVQKTGETIRNQKALNERLYFFKDRTIEVWIFLGGTTPFARRDALRINKGVGASDSVVEANNTFYWFGDDGDFYVMNGNQAQVLSDKYRRYTDTMFNASGMYGLHYEKDKSVKWFSPIDGKCFVYDYKKQYFYEDNEWEHGQWERMPFNSYMELDNKQYTGDYVETGKVYEWSSDYNDDNGKFIRAYRRLAVKLSEGNNRVRINRLRFRFRGRADTYGETIQFGYRVRLDRKAWGMIRQIDFNSKGEPELFYDVPNLGVAREMEIEVMDVSDVPFLLTNMDLTVSEMGN